MPIHSLTIGRYVLTATGEPQTDWVAIYAAFVATVAVVWQGWWQWYQHRRAGRLAVELLAKEITKQDIHSVAKSVCRLTAINHSAHPIRVRGATCNPAGDPIPEEWIIVDVTVNTEDAEEIDLPISNFLEQEWYGRGQAVGWVQLSTGEWISSQPFQPMSGYLSETPPDDY